MRSLKAFALRWAGSRCVSRSGSGPQWACSEREPGEGGPKSLRSIWLFGRVSILGKASSHPGVSATFRGPPAYLCRHSRHQEVPLRKRLSAAPAPASGVSPGCSAASQLPSADVLEPAHGRSVTHTSLSPSGCSSTAPACREDHVWSAASLPPGFFPHPATPPFQFGRTRRDRRSGPDSAAGVSPGRHFVSRDGSGAAWERGRFHEVTRRRRFPGVQGSQGSSRRRLQLGQATLTTGG
ncbi:hypothetical protein NDU88_003270 [Pleurodeles waltl]|uniref:Uncharacterized protein n=1 Tax=Pleurodeles waltl TaxID=8319 RepID=A0AAV7SFF7_PLEWA|nr:hypothetical protein NDU88_003270 [Pleurodeles waltl]